MLAEAREVDVSQPLVDPLQCMESVVESAFHFLL